jgi:Omp85 superfamily domain
MNGRGIARSGLVGASEEHAELQPKERWMKVPVTIVALVAAAAFPALTCAQTAPAAPREPLFEEPQLIANGMARAEKFSGDGTAKDGFYPELGQMITGSGWISAGPGYRRHFLGGAALVDASAAVSWRLYKIAQTRLEFPTLANDRLTLGTKLLWDDFTQVRYFGVGTETHVDDISDYRIRSTNIVGYAEWRPIAHVAVTGSVGFLSRPKITHSGGSFDRSDPDTLIVHAGDPAAALPLQPRFAHAELSVVADTRDYPSHPSSGTVLRGAWSTYRDQSGGTFTFDRYEGEAAYFLPVLGSGVLAAHVWGVFSATGDGHEVPFYMMPGLGGQNTLRGFDDYRYHDRNFIAFNLESRWALLKHVDAALLFDAGDVAARAGDVDFDRTSVGVGLRVHTIKTTLARFDVAHSREGWRVLFKLTDSLRLGRLSKRMAAIPFVP